MIQLGGSLHVFTRVIQWSLCTVRMHMLHLAWTTAHRSADRPTTDPGCPKFPYQRCCGLVVADAAALGCAASLYKFSKAALPVLSAGRGFVVVFLALPPHLAGSCGLGKHHRLSKAAERGCDRSGSYTSWAAIVRLSFMRLTPVRGACSA